MPKRWSIATYDQARVDALKQAAGIPAVVAQLLLTRGIRELDDVQRFLDPKPNRLRDPELLPGATEAAQLIYDAVQSKRQITIYGDYDADGMTSTAILLRCLRLLGAEVDFYVPHRIDEGYGLNGDALRSLAEKGTELIITVDCGIASVDEADLAHELGLTLIVTDHHQMADRLPRAAAIVHPGLPNSDYPFPGLCGAAVAFKLAWALCTCASQSKQVSERMRNYLLQAMGLAAIGTVADMVPLVDENRILVRYGLKTLTERPMVGTQAMIRQAKLDRKQMLDSDDLGFMLCPRLNAAGRLGQAEMAIELLTTENQQRAETLAKYMDDLNTQRQSVERSIQLAATKQMKKLEDFDNTPAIVLSDHQWHPGVIGIVAGRLAEKHNRPTVLVAADPLGVKPGIGSARSASGLNLHEALAECSHLLESHGGHEAAAGLRVKDSQFDAFRQAFCQVVAQRLAENAETPELRIDAETPLHMLTRKVVQQIESLAPFGKGNSRPMLCASEVRLSGQPKRIGNGGRHLSMTLDQGGVKMRAVAFGGGDWEEELAELNGTLSVAFRPVINHFAGRSTVEVHLADWHADQ